MRLALLSDIHANLQALQACMAHAETQNVTRLAFLGDLIGYGANPCQVLDCIMEQILTHNAIAVLGNHDQMALSPSDYLDEHGNAQYLGAITAQWTHDQLKEYHRNFLEALPTIYCEQSLFLTHASALEPSQWHYIKNEQDAYCCMQMAKKTHAAARYVFTGHIHEQQLFFQTTKKWLPARFLKKDSFQRYSPPDGLRISLARHSFNVATVGSVGQPRDGNPKAMYAVFDSLDNSLTFHRVPYDHYAAANAIYDADLPTFLGFRLEEGL